MVWNFLMQTVCQHEKKNMLNAKSRDYFQFKK